MPNFGTTRARGRYMDIPSGICEWSVEVTKLYESRSDRFFELPQNRLIPFESLPLPEKNLPDSTSRWKQYHNLQTTSWVIPSTVQIASVSLGRYSTLWVTVVGLHEPLHFHRTLLFSELSLPEPIRNRSHRLLREPRVGLESRFEKRLTLDLSLSWRLVGLGFFVWIHFHVETLDVDVRNCKVSALDVS